MPISLMPISSIPILLTFRKSVPALLPYITDMVFSSEYKLGFPILDSDGSQFFSFYHLGYHDLCLLDNKKGSTIRKCDASLFIFVMRNVLLRLLIRI